LKDEKKIHRRDRAAPQIGTRVLCVSLFETAAVGSVVRTSCVVRCSIADRENRYEDAHRDLGAPAAPARVLRLFLRLPLLLALLIGINQVAHRAIASWFVNRAAHAASLSGNSSAELTAHLRRAMELDPENPRYPALLARAQQYSLASGDTAEVLRLSERAAALGPRRANLWVELGSAYEWAGHQDRAQRAFEHALALFPDSPQINWQLANYSLRANHVHTAASYLRVCILQDASLRRPAFDLAWRATGDARFVPNEVLPADIPAQLAYLDYVADTARLDAAADVWAQLRNAGLAFPPTAAFHYLDALRDAHRIAEMDAAWTALAARHADGIPRRGPGENLMVNGDFETEPINGGFDWLVMEAPGVTVRTVSSFFYTGGRSLEIRFHDKENISYAHVVQFVPVRSGAHYHFVAHLRAEGITSDRGPHIEIRDHFDPAALRVTLPEVLGSAGWSAYSIDFKTGPATSLLAVRVLRAPSPKFLRGFRGTLWLDQVSLVPIP
jgi:tetratricopeptide (TPR) repeat protein